MKKGGTILFIAAVAAGMLAPGPAHAISDCFFSGVNFSNGAVSCQAGRQFRCSDGDWVPLDLPCASPPPSPTVTNPADCMCTDMELAACDSRGQACCVSLEGGTCTKRCCPLL